MPNLFLDVRTNLQRVIEQFTPNREAPMQGVLLQPDDVSVKTITGPFYASTVTSAGSILPAQKGIRYLIHAVQTSMYNAAAGTASSIRTSAYVGGSSRRISDLRTIIGNEDAQVNNNVIDVLTDPGQAVTVATDGAGVTDWHVTVFYREIRETQV